MKNLLAQFRPGLRGKLVLFVGGMLFVLVSVILVIALKQQHGALREFSLREVNARLEPVQGLTREVQYTVRNFLRLRALADRIDAREKVLERGFRAYTQKKAAESPSGKTPVKKTPRPKTSSSKKQDGNEPSKADAEQQARLAFARLYYNRYFDVEYLAAARRRLRNRLERRAGRPLTDQEFDEMEDHARLVHKRLDGAGARGKALANRFIHASYHGRRLDEKLREIFGYGNAMRTAFRDLDLSRYRIESINLYYDTHFDTFQLEPWKEVKAGLVRINGELRRARAEKDGDAVRAALEAYRVLDKRRRRLSSVDYKRINTINMDAGPYRAGLILQRNAFYDGRPLIRDELHEPADDYMVTTRSIYHNPAVTERALRIKKSLQGPQRAFWRSYLNRQRVIRAQMRDLVDRLLKQARKLREEKPEQSPVEDDVYKTLLAAYEALTKKRKALADEYEHRFLERSRNALQDLKERRAAEISEQKALNEKIAANNKALRGVSRKKNPEEYARLRGESRRLRKLRTESRTLIKELAPRIKNFYDESRETADAYRNLRSVILADHMVMRFSYDAGAYSDYVESSVNRKAAQAAWADLRAWIRAGCAELTRCSGASLSRPLGEGLLLLTRGEAQELAWELDLTGLDQLADRALFENIAGFTRIFFDQSETAKRLRKERRSLIDTAVAFGLRLILLALILSVVLVRAIRSIIAGANRVGAGDLGVRFDYQGRDELGTLSDSLNSMVVGLREREEMRGELKAAEEIQRQLLPTKMPANMDGYLSFGHFYKAMSGVGGDYYDFIEAGPNEMVFCIADVSNHGVGPAIVMTLMRAQLRGIVRRGTTEPRAILSELNARLHDETPAGIFVTIFLGKYNRTNFEMQYCSAGHNRSLLYHYREERLEELDRGGMPLGAMENDIFQPSLKPGSIKLEAGDLFFQYTDGVNEARNDDGSFYGYERLMSMLTTYARKKPEVICRAIALDVERVSGKAIMREGPSELNDDVAMIAFRRLK